MQLPSADFLGYNQFSKYINGSSVWLTDYAANPKLEEWHSHQNASLSLLLSGTYLEELGGKTHCRVPGAIKYIPEGQSHRCSKYAIGTRNINLDLSPALFKETATTSEHIEKLLANQAPQSKFALLRLVSEIQDTDNYLEASAQLLLYELLLPQDKGKPHVKQAKKVPRWVTSIKEQLHDGWNTNPELWQLASTAGIHPVSLSRYFPHYFGMTLSEYMRQLKIDGSLALIRSSQFSLTAIAYRCGFADQAHFTRTFRKLTGFLPKDFKKI